MSDNSSKIDDNLKSRIELEIRDKDRLVTFVDAVFAIAITLLGLEFVVPLLSHSDVVILNFLGSYWPKFVGYFLAFFLLGLFLNIHNRQFNNIKYADQKIWWINILLLSFIALVPFATSLWTEYSDTAIGVLFFHCTMLISGIILYLNWSYVKKHKYFLRKDITPRTITVITYRNLAIPIASLIAIGLAFLNPLLSNLAYGLILVIIFLSPRIHR